MPVAARPLELLLELPHEGLVVEQPRELVVPGLVARARTSRGRSTRPTHSVTSRSIVSFRRRSAASTSLRVQLAERARRRSARAPGAGAGTRSRSRAARSRAPRAGARGRGPGRRAGCRGAAARAAGRRALARARTMKVGMSPSWPRRPSRCSDGIWSSRGPPRRRRAARSQAQGLDLGRELLERGRRFAHAHHVHDGSAPRHQNLSGSLQFRCFSSPTRRSGQVAVPASRAPVPPAPAGAHANNQRKEATMAVSMRELLEAGVHFGHQTRRWNPKMRRFIFGERGGIYIIDLQKTLESLEEAQSVRAQPRRARRHRPLRRHQEAGAGLRRGGGQARRHAVRQPPLARRPAHQLAHDLGADRAPARAAAPARRGPARPAPAQGADLDAGRAREARGEPRRRRRHAPAARRRSSSSTCARSSSPCARRAGSGCR